MKVIISENAYQKINHWVQKADFEVSGFGKIVHDSANDSYTITDVFLVKQEGTGASTDIDQQALAQLMYKTKDIPGMLNFWWHSHVNMDVFWSVTDKETIEELGGNGLCVATVFNKKKEMRTAICAQMSGMIGNKTCFWDNISTEVEHPKIDTSEWDKEFDDNVQRKKWFTTSDVGLGAIRSTNRGEDPYNAVPYWAQEEAKLLDMNPWQYYNKTLNGPMQEIENLEKALDNAAKKKYNMSYDAWADSLMKGYSWNT